MGNLARLVLPVVAITTLSPRLSGAVLLSASISLPLGPSAFSLFPGKQLLRLGGRFTPRRHLFEGVRGKLPRALGVGWLRMSSDVASLPIDPTAGSLDSKVPAELDRSKLRDPATVPEGMTPAVLVACGSYSPPTVLHTRIFETARDFFVEAKDSLKVDIIGGFISPVHEAYGKKGLAPMPDRIEMVKYALDSSDWVSCDEWETKQNEWTRTRLSLDRMHIEVNRGNTSGKDIKVMLLCGADILDSMVTPGVWTESDLHVLLSRGARPLFLLLSKSSASVCNVYTHRPGGPVCICPPRVRSLVLPFLPPANLLCTYP